MSALPAPTPALEQSGFNAARRYPLRLRATIMIGSALGAWALVGLVGWLLYRAVI
jgi:hypothetical protein